MPSHKKASTVRVYLHEVMRVGTFRDRIWTAAGQGLGQRQTGKLSYNECGISAWNMKGVGEVAVCTTIRVHLIPGKNTLQIVKMFHFMLYVYYHNLKI